MWETDELCDASTPCKYCGRAAPHNSHCRIFIDARKGKACAYCRRTGRVGCSAGRPTSGNGAHLVQKKSQCKVDPQRKRAGHARQVTTNEQAPSYNEEDDSEPTEVSFINDITEDWSSERENDFDIDVGWDYEFASESTDESDDESDDDGNNESGDGSDDEREDKDKEESENNIGSHVINVDSRQDSKGNKTSPIAQVNSQVNDQLNGQVDAQLNGQLNIEESFKP